MKQMTYAEALNIVTQTINAIDIAANGFTIEQQDKLGEALERIEALQEKYKTARTESESTKAARKAKKSAARQELVANTAPAVLAAMSDEPRTAADIYGRAADSLPEDWNIYKVQYLLLHELADKVDKIEAKGKPNLYRLSA